MKNVNSEDRPLYGKGGGTPALLWGGREQRTSNAERRMKETGRMLCPTRDDASTLGAVDGILVACLS